MTVEAVTRKAGPYACEAGVDYPFFFKVFSASDVYVVLAENGIETLAGLGTDYVVRLNANQDNEPGGAVTLLCEAAGKTVTIGSCVPYTQEVVITNKGGFYPTILNKAYDKLTILVQQLLEEVSRCVKVTISGQEKPDTLIQTLYESAQTAKESAQFSAGKAEDAAASAMAAAESAGDAAGSAASAEGSAEDAWAWANTAEDALYQTDAHAGYSAYHYAQKAKANADAAASAIMPGSLVGQLFYGQIVLSAVPIDSDGLCLLDGRQLEKGGRYDKFINHIAGLKEDHPGLFVTETAWWATVGQYGSCGKFVLGEDKIRLPKVSDILQCTTDMGACGEMVGAGLPNITGEMPGWTPSPVDAPQSVDSSALYWGGIGSQSMVIGNGVCRDSLTFNAARANSLYGASDTVQPQTLKVLAYMVVDAVDVNALNALLKTVNEKGQPGQVLVKGEEGLEWGSTGSCQDVFFLENSTRLDVSHFGSLIFAGLDTPGVVMTLPKSDAAAKGKKITISANRAGVTVNPYEGDHIRYSGLTSTADGFFLPGFETVTLICSGNGNWTVVASASLGKPWQTVSRQTGVVYTNEGDRMINAMISGISTTPSQLSIVQIERTGSSGIYSRGIFLGNASNVGITASLSIAPGESYRYGVTNAASLVISEQTV